ncbi:MAG: HAD-IIIA family hydrolase [Phycisphaerales bacterium]|nr:HAD-IIIA family hydrolase [Phycisphaerales bacterium]
MPHAIQLLILDVDGVLTDGSIAIDDHGIETKRFNVRDGLGIVIWQRLGYQTAILTSRSSMAVRHRANELGIAHVIQGSKDKLRDFARLLATLGLDAEQVAMIGDDLPDLPILQRVGYAITVADAASECVGIADYVTSARGGRGAVREAIEHLLRVRHEWDQALATYENGDHDEPDA